MAIRSDSYSSTDEVLTMTRHLLEGEVTFNSTTRPTLVEVEGFINQASGALNVSLAKHGLQNADIALNGTATLACDSWVRMRATQFAEMTHPVQGFQGDNDSRAELFGQMFKDADKFVSTNVLGWKRLDISVADPTNQGLSNAAETKQSSRSDPDDSSLSQPLFKRGLFDA